MKKGISIYWLFILIGFYVFPLKSYADIKNYNSFQLEQDSLFLISQGDSIKSLSIEARVSVLKNKERMGESASKWAIIWNYSDKSNYNYIELTWNNSNFGGIIDQRNAIISIVEIKNDVKIIDKKISLDDGVNMALGYNTISLEVVAGKYNVYVGNKKLNHIATLEYAEPIIGDCGLKTSVSANVSKLVVSTMPNIVSQIQTLYTADNILKLFCGDEIEGFWGYLDRDNNPEWAILGGQYRIAILKDGIDYLIIYISGAITNKKIWKEGMIKGRLNSTIFKNHYDVEWYDATFNILKDEVSASLENSILKIDFPLYKTSVRFYKEQ